MFSLSQLLSLTAFALVCKGSTLPNILGRSSEGLCTGAQLQANTSIPVGDNQVQLQTFSCSISKGPSPDDLLPPTDTPTNVCGGICTDACGDDGILPPITEDCGTIVQAIDIFVGNEPTFTVASGSMIQLTFGTCRFFYTNFSPFELEYCWNDLANQSLAAASACFPPIQPVMSLGVCNSLTDLWQVGVGHS